ncbi:PREDICTED: E3 ubiquitin-protein ligase UBR4 [Papilio polytes]|uniref:E3 ubiquitin-protein ligase UBR4 n=1 Tax=Papilio polytes TaxID=76194 RepID=UPI0006761F19|nr:PREDICTED: E3 ubiquitin-protein ligase UBR4 [Papilio polytes]
MAASGGNIEWSTTVKPILTALYGPFFDKNDAVEIIQAIIKSESEFQNHEDVYDLFYTCFACLSAHFISINANNLPIDQLSTARDAFRIILGQILKKLSEAGLSYDETAATTAAPNVSIKQLLLPIVGLCGVDGGGYPQSDLVILTSLLKNAKLPAHVNVSETQTTKTSVIPSPITSLTSQTASNNEKQAPSSAQRRSDALLEQLTMPLRNPAASVPSTQVQPSAAVMSPGSKDSLESSKEANTNQQPSVDMKKWVATTCGSLLMELRAGFIMLKVCSSLPCLQRYLNRWQMSKESAISPQFNSDASLLHFLVNEVNVCRLALSLPCLEPFTADRIATLSDVATAWLLCATAQASLHPKDEESEQQTATLVESALSLYNTVGDTFRQSTRAGGYVYQNHLMIGAWVLLCGLHHALAGAPCPTTAPGKSPAKTPSRPYNLTKMQQGLGAVWVALGGRCLAWDNVDVPARTHNIVPDKSEPYSYITLATEVFTLLNAEMMSEGAERLGSGALQLHEAHQALLAALAKDLDRETARTDTGTISSCFGARLGGLYASFSAALVRYLHNLSGAPAFAALQPVGPRVVKLLGSMILSKSAAERENSILVMWHKIINTLQECALQPQPSQDHDYEDLNVEHAQLLVYLFHSLTLMQKKSVLLMTSNAIIKVVETLAISDRKRAVSLAPHQLMLTTRLMLLLEYLMRHLYDAPQTLLQQIEWNLVIAPGLAEPTAESSTNGAKTTTDNGQIKSRIYCEVPYIEAAYRCYSQDESSMRPKFYALTSAEINNQENPKFDGLACNFVLGTPHKLKYPLLLDALLALLNAACVCDNTQHRAAPAALAAAHYCFQTAWRLVISMPPATPHMDKLQAGTKAELPSPLPLHAVIWAPRADNKKVFNPWLKDALVKQGMYTQYAENLLAGVSASCDNIKYTAWLASETIKHLKQNITSSGLPSLLDVISCDAALVRLKVCLADTTSAAEAHQFMPNLLDLLDTILDCCRLSAGAELENVLEPANDSCERAVNAARLAVCCAFYASHIIPSESAVLNLVSSHCELISGSSKYSIGTSLMMLAYSAAKLLDFGAPKLADNAALSKKAIDLIIPALADGRLEFLTEPLRATLNTLVPQTLTAEQLRHEHFLKTTYTVLVEHLQPSTEKTLRYMVKYWEKILDRSAGRKAYEAVFSEDNEYSLGKILLTAPNARSPYTVRVIKLFIKIFTCCDKAELNPALCISVCKSIGMADQQKLANLLSHICLTTTGSSTSNGTSGTANGTPTEAELATPTSSAPDGYKLSPAPRAQSDTAQQSANSESCSWSDGSKESAGAAVAEAAPAQLADAVNDNATLLSALCKHIVTHCEEVSERVLCALVGVCGEGCAPVLLRELCRLADAHAGADHRLLFPAAVGWLAACVDNLSNSDVLEKLEEGQIEGAVASQIESACVLLSYLADALHAINTSPPQAWRSVSPSWESPYDVGFDLEYPDEQNDEEDTSADDSDEDAMLQYKLCTFTVTQREFMNQHWYHCHTCKMVDGVGVCTVCARVCHRGHDVSYAKFGNFFCDCGAKPDSSCQALVKRSVTLGGNRSDDSPPASSLRRLPSSPTPPAYLAPSRRPALAANIQGCRSYLVSYGAWGTCMDRVKKLLGVLAGPVRAACERGAAVGAHGRAQRALAQLHLGVKRFVHTDTLMLPTLGSQEGAFENVRMTYTGENGQTIRQLMSAHKLRRVAMCCLASPHGRRQHLAVSHEKGKITVLQLSALLKQADSSKHKLTLTRLSSAPIPFTVLSLSGNAWNEDLLAVCGLKECHVLTFNSGGAVADHLVLNTGLEGNNYVIKAIWLPGSQTQLALVTSDFVKIFDLSKDLNNPMHHFLVPSGKVRDVTFVNQEDVMHMLCMSSAGHIYWQPMSEESRATLGTFYVTNTLEVLHPEIQDVAGLVGGGGVGVLAHGLRHADHTLHALADILHAFQLHADNDAIDFGNQIYLSLLLAEDQMISFGTKAALMRVLRPRVKRRRVYIPSPPNTPGATSSVTTAPPASSTAEAVASESDVSTARDDQQENQFMDVDDALEPMVLLAPDGGSLEALLDIPADADDETMVQLAIALSLQEQPRRAPPAPSAPPPPAPGFSDVTASPTGSDDEGSTAATDGSTLRTSPAEPPGSMAANAIIAAPVAMPGPSTSSAQPVASSSRTAEAESEARRLHALRLSLLSAALDALPSLRALPGVRAIPFVQVVLMLAGDLDSTVEGDRVVLDRLLDLLVSELDIQTEEVGERGERQLQLAINRLEQLVSELEAPENVPPVHERTNRRELQLVIMRLLSYDAFVSDGSKFQEQKVPILVQQIIKQVNHDELRMFVKAFLLETNSTAVRWQAHALLLAIYNNSPQSEQASIVSLLWALWPTLPQYGRKSAQFVDLLGYFTLKTPNIETEKYLRSAVELLRRQNELLSSHGNAALYAALGTYVELDGYFLESEPCLVCNNPEVPMVTIKLPTIKMDSKFTTTTQIVKLVNSHTISRIALRISDIKRGKMVRAINFYYNNRTVQAVQELKNKPGMWHKAKRVQLQSGQSEVRVDFPLPIVACNLMMEYADFYENQQATGESLQCPRCSQSVPANPGVCANCGENVFQCHKCRAINYDEKDPFLCHACGFCKYAKDLSKIIQKVLACRKELVTYDRSQSEQLKGETLPVYAGLVQTYDGDMTKESGGGCYGCSLASAEQCLTLLRALASQPEHRERLCRFGVVHELVHHNLHRGTPQCQEEVRALICLVTRDNLPATEQLCHLLSQRITLSLMGHAASQDHNNSVRPLVLLLGSLVKVQDSVDCWEARLRCIVKLWVWCCPQLTEVAGIAPAVSSLLKTEAIAGIPGISSASPTSHQFALQQVALPCLGYLQQLMLPPDATLPLRDVHLARKYLAKWRDRVLLSHGMRPLALEDGGWLRPVMFDPSSRIARDTACAMVKSLCDSYERTKAVLILLTSFLPEVGTAGEASEQFLQLYQSLASEAPWKQFLALRGVLQQIADLMTKEIEQLHRLEETTLTSDLAQGYALKRLTELLSMFLEEGGGRRVYKGRLVGAVLGGYLSLRRLVVQRTRLTDDTQEKLLELLEEMTTGTEAETAEFMAVCIETVQKYPLHDYRTPVFIFERLCSIIYPEENDVGEFFLTLEKDPQQEDFLQGRMLGNPYSSLEPGMGPLMRDVKNKICTDCELVALLEDDNGMELLVCNKIMSLDLPVKDVYKKVWCTSGDGVDAMRVVYRMRGLLGDATEEFVETLSQTNAEAVDDEQLYRMANVLADCGGLEVMLQRLAAIQRVGGARALCSTLLRLLGLCARVRRCVRVLTRADTRALPVLLRALQLAADEEKDMPRAHLVYQLLEIMERILSVAASESLVSFLQFSLTFGGPEYVQALINCTECPGIRNNSVALGHLTRVLAALVYGNDLKMAMLVDHFKPVLDFDRLDSEQWTEEEFRMELFCVLCANIERNSIGGTLKDYLISLGVVRDALEYIVKHAPCVKPTLVCTDSDELKEFISRPALKYILRFLTGLAADHEPTQMLVCEKVIPIVHRLEQVSSGEHVGSLAENLLEALRSQPQCAAKVQQVRDFTRQEKKRLAMAVRERQLGALGMRSNERGQVTAQCSLTQQLADLAEEAGAVCCICREGYKYQPTKVLGIYTFTKRCPVEEFEVRARKTLGYTTVSHYNIVHVECHMAAVRLARARDEWESAALQNASTRCNGLLPLWGPHVPESAFASCLARHTTYLQECTGHRDIGYTCTVHDLKLLLVRFARGRTFHDDTGGGGPLSNMQLVPALLHMALYVINTTRAAAREVGALEASLAWAPARLLEAAHDADGPVYYATFMLLLYPHAKWQSLRVSVLKRLLVTAHVRAVAPAGPAMRALAQEHRAPKQWADYKPYAIFFAIIDLLYTVMFKNVSATTVEQWPVKLAEYIRHNDEANAKAAERIVATLTDELLPSASFAELCDAAGLLRDLPDPDDFLRAAIEELP